MATSLPRWMIVVLVLQFLLTGAFFLLGYSMTSSLRQGAAPVALDVLVLALPLVSVAIFGALAVTLWRARRHSLARTAALAPLPLSAVLFAFLGVV